MAANNTEKVVIIIPTYNERGNIDRLIPVLVTEIFPTIPKRFEMHILVVDDSSPDGTADEVRVLERKHKNVHLFLNKRKAGLGGAYRKGMQHALEKLKADIVFQFDADFSHDPKLIAPMLQKTQEGYDVVLGSRYIAGGSIPENWGLHRKFLSVVGNLIIRIVITHFSIHDWTTGYRAIRSRVVEEVLPKLSGDRFTGYTFQIGFLHKTVRAGFKVAEVPLKFVDRTLGKSKLGAEYIKNTLRYIIKVRLSEIFHSRIFKFLVVGGIGFLVNFVGFRILRTFNVWPSIAGALAAELAIFSNFTLNNLWTFKDKKLTGLLLRVRKFVEFNITSLGSLVIQTIVIEVGTRILGIQSLLTVASFSLNSDDVYLMIGVLLGMIWNYTMYTRVIWKTKS